MLRSVSNSDASDEFDDIETVDLKEAERYFYSPEVGGVSGKYGEHIIDIEECDSDYGETFLHRPVMRTGERKRGRASHYALPKAGIESAGIELPVKKTETFMTIPENAKRLRNRRKSSGKDLWNVLRHLFEDGKLTGKVPKKRLDGKKSALFKKTLVDKYSDGYESPSGYESPIETVDSPTAVRARFVKTYAGLKGRDEVDEERIEKVVEETLTDIEEHDPATYKKLAATKGQKRSESKSLTALLEIMLRLEKQAEEGKASAEKKLDKMIKHNEEKKARYKKGKCRRCCWVTVAGLYGLISTGLNIYLSVTRVQGDS